MIIAIDNNPFILSLGVCKTAKQIEAARIFVRFLKEKTMIFFCCFNPIRGYRNQGTKALFSDNLPVINSRTVIAGGIIGILLVILSSLSRFLLLPYALQSRQIYFCSFVHVISTELCVTSFATLIAARFCSFAWLRFWSCVTYVTLKNDFLTLSLIFLFFDSKR